MKRIVNFHRWHKTAVFVLVAVAYLLVFSQRTGPGVISNELQRQFRVSATMLGTMASVQYFLYMLLQIPAGLTGDKFGPERLFAAGVVLDGVGTLIFSHAQTFSALLFGRAVVGLGDALIWVNIVLILAKWFAPSEFTIMLGLVGTAGNLGGILTTIPFAVWIASAGWRAPFTVLGSALIVVAVLNLIVLQMPKRGKAGNGRWAARNGRIGRRDVSSSTDGISSPGASKREVPDTLLEPKVKIQRVPVWKTLSTVVRDRLAWATFGCHFGIVGTYIGFLSLWAIPYFMATYHVSRSGATYFTLTSGVGALIGGPVTAAISERLHRRRLPYIVLQAFTTLAWLAIVFWQGSPPFALAFLLMFVLGFGSGGSLLTFAAIRDATPKERSGVTSGFANTGGFLSAVLLPVLFGTVVDWFDPAAARGFVPTAHAYGMAFWVPALFSLVGLFGAVMIVEKRDRNSLALQSLK